MPMVPEERSAILHTCWTAAIAVTCGLGAIWIRRSLTRILLLVVAVPFTLFTLFGLYVTELIAKYGPR